MIPPITLFDIGASGKPNQYIKKLNSISRIACEIFLVEPSDMFVSSLPNSKVVKKAVGKTSGSATLWDPEVGGASLYKRNNDIVGRYVPSSAFSGKLSQSHIQLTSFSELKQELSVVCIDALKVDTQGSELDILESIDSSGLIDSCFLIEVEVPSVPASYREQPELSEVISFFEKKGFWLGNVNGNYAKDISHRAFRHGLSAFALACIKENSRKRVMDIDCVFFANPLTILDSKCSATVMKYAVILAAWGFHLEAISITGEAHSLGILSGPEFKSVISIVTALGAGSYGAFKLLLKLPVRFIRFIAYSIRKFSLGF